jgi:hypothetical protein
VRLNLLHKLVHPHLRPQVYERCRTSNNTAAHLRSDVPLCLPLLLSLLLLLLWLLLLLPFFCCAGSVRSLSNGACRSWLVCFLHCGSNLRPALLLAQVSAVLFGCWTADALAGPSYTISSRCHCALAYRLHSAEHSPSVVPLYSPRHQIKTLLYLCISPWREKRSSAGTENQAARLSLGQRWGEIAVRSFTVSSRIASPTGCSPERT